MVHIITGADLAKLMQSTLTFAVIDVREDDYEVGKVKGSINVPFYQLESRIGELVQKFSSMPIVVFHCHFSMQRGPKAASLFERELRQTVSDSRTQVFILKGGFKEWHNQFRDQPLLYEKL